MKLLYDKIKAKFENKNNSNNDDQYNTDKYNFKIEFIDDEISRAYSVLNISTKDYPDYELEWRKSVSLGR